MATPSPWFWRMWLRRRTRYRPANWKGYLVLISAILAVVIGLQMVFNPGIPGGPIMWFAGGAFGGLGMWLLVWACHNRSGEHPDYPYPYDEFL